MQRLLPLISLSHKHPHIYVSSRSQAKVCSSSLGPSSRLSQQEQSTEPSTCQAVDSQPHYEAQLPSQPPPASSPVDPREEEGCSGGTARPFLGRHVFGAPLLRGEGKQEGGTKAERLLERVLPSRRSLGSVPGRCFLQQPSLSLPFQREAGQPGSFTLD